jgi:RNA polymerase sigma factor (sigma-70 family)
MKLRFVNLGERLCSLRRNAHKSQKVLAAACQALGLPITGDMIASWETNRAEIPARFIPFIAYILDAKVADLLPDLPTPVLAGLKRLSSRPGDSNNKAQPQKASTPAPSSANHPTRFISEFPKTRGITSVFLAENETSPLDALILSETRSKLMTLVRALNHRHRQVLLLRYYAGLKFREIAARLNLPIGNVQARFYAARSQMIRLLHWDPRFDALGKELRDQFPPLRESGKDQ